MLIHCQALSGLKRSKLLSSVLYFAITTFLLSSSVRSPVCPNSSSLTLLILAVKRQDDGTEKRVCIDGKQRLTSIYRFMKGEIASTCATLFSRG